MLEKYSKNKQLYVRKRKAARKKRKPAEVDGAQPPIPEEYAGEEEEDMEPDRDQPSYAEHAFAFTAFEKVSRTCPGCLQDDS